MQLRDKLVLLLFRLGLFLNFGLLQANGFVKLLVEQLSFLQDGKDSLITSGAGNKQLILSIGSAMMHAGTNPRGLRFDS